MEIEKIFSEKTTIDITVVKLNNQKLTKSIFNQLRWYFPFDGNFNFTSELLFGHVRIGEERFAIGKSKTSLFRFNVEYLETIASSGKMNMNFKRQNDELNFEELLGIKSIKHEFLGEHGEFSNDFVGNIHTVGEVLTDDGKKKLTEISERAKLFAKELQTRQILL